MTRTFWGKIKKGATVRGIPFEINIECASDLFTTQGAKCALSGVDINLSSELRNSNPDYRTFTASLDRKDSDKGYVEGNVQWVHKQLNRMKGTLTDKEFVEWCRLVATSNNR